MREATGGIVGCWHRAEAESITMQTHRLLRRGMVDFRKAEPEVPKDHPFAVKQEVRRIYPPT